MNRREFLLSTAAGASAAAASAPSAAAVPERVDFSYAFAPPHRMTVGRPEASEKTLLDVEPGSLKISWTYDDLRDKPLATFLTPRTAWKVKVRPQVDGQPIATSVWRRGGGFLPMLDNEYRDQAGTVRLEAIGGEGAALIRVTARNTDTREHRFTVPCEMDGAWVCHNPAWMEAGVDADTLVAGQFERPDRVLLFALGGGPYPVEAKSIALEWNIPAGGTRTGWLVRPYQAYQADLPRLRTRDWAANFEAARKEWEALLGRAVKYEIPDEGVNNALYACLGDVFIMREPIKDGYLGTTCGTEGYRATNPGEPTLAGIALDQYGYPAEAANGLRVHLDMQEPNGNWADPKGWGHHCWSAGAFKAWSGMEHYRLTGDRAFLAKLYPRMAASSRWQESMRAKTRNAANVAERGLLPRGMGDCGLMNGKDYCGVFYAHNILPTFADRLAAEAAQEAGAPAEEVAQLRKIYETALAALRTSLERGAIEEDGYRWIPNTAGNTDGSRWGMLYTLFPGRLFAADDPLVTGSMKKIEHAISTGGQPIHTGWMEDGAWVGITIDNVAEAHLAMGNGDAAIRYLYSSLNHGTPLYTWCEERGLEPGAKKTSGDLQHLWTPVAVLRFLRDALVMELDDTLHLALGTARGWLEQGKRVGVQGAPTHFGEVAYTLESGVAHGVIRADVRPPVRRAPRELVLHVRHPERRTMRAVSINGAAVQEFDAAKESVGLPLRGERLRVEIAY